MTWRATSARPATAAPPAPQAEVEFTVKCSYLEIYNETVADLLAGGSLTSTRLTLNRPTKNRNRRAVVCEGEGKCSYVGLGVGRLPRTESERLYEGESCGHVRSRFECLFSMTLLPGGAGLHRAARDPRVPEEGTGVSVDVRHTSSSLVHSVKTHLMTW